MTVTATYYDHEKNAQVKNSEKFPETMLQSWEFSNAQGRYLPNAVRVTVSDGKAKLGLQLFAGYLRCCGMREFGDICFNYEHTSEIKKALVKELFNHPWFKKNKIGALLYTKVKYSDETPADKYGWEFVDNWPGTVTEGGWWYNPNSGNYCCNVTLSFDAEAAAEEYEEDEEDYEDEE